MKKMIQPEGYRISYTLEGTGVPLVLLHGFAEDHTWWNSWKDRLQGCRLIIPDLPGFGESEPLPPGWAMRDLALAVSRILVAEEVTSAVVVGHSMGGYVALQLARHEPGQVAGLGLFHSTALADTPEKREGRLRSVEFIRQHGTIPYLKALYAGLVTDAFQKNHPQCMDQWLEKGARFGAQALTQGLLAMRNREDSLDLLQQTKIPVMILGGSQDQVVPADTLPAQALLPAVASYVLLPGTAHMGMVESPEAAAAAVQQFMALCR